MDDQQIDELTPHVEWLSQSAMTARQAGYCGDHYVYRLSVQGTDRGSIREKDARAIVAVCNAAPEMFAEIKRLREALETIHLGRAWCSQCESYDHECGCSPDVNERRRQQALASIPTSN